MVRQGPNCDSGRRAKVKFQNIQRDTILKVFQHSPGTLIVGAIILATYLFTCGDVQCVCHQTHHRVENGSPLAPSRGDGH
jgi:hypothetical protein